MNDNTQLGRALRGLFLRGATQVAIEVRENDGYQWVVNAWKDRQHIEHSEGPCLDDTVVLAAQGDEE